MATPSCPHCAASDAQLQQAFEVMRGAGWPATLAALQLDASTLATARVRVVLAAAGHLARGGQLQRPDLFGPITNARLKRAASSASPASPPPARRHGDAGPDRKRIASGDRDDQ